MLNRYPPSERGSALVTAMLVMMLLMAFGIATAALVDTDQADSRRERERESSFQLTEGALNAQLYQLSTRWPGATTATAYPLSCGPVSSEADCPNGAAIQQNFTGADYASGISWVSQVRDNGGTSPNYWSEDLLTSQPSYDRNDDNFV
jgi:Tfp pilus assembly protein PilX